MGLESKISGAPSKLIRSEDKLCSTVQYSCRKVKVLCMMSCQDLLLTVLYVCLYFVMDRWIDEKEILLFLIDGASK